LEYKDIIHIKNNVQSNIPANNSPSKTKNPDELNINPISREENLATDETNDSMRQYICNKCAVNRSYKRRLKYSSRLWRSLDLYTPICDLLIVINIFFYKLSQLSSHIVVE
jgi:hypothetical protein